MDRARPRHRVRRERDAGRRRDDHGLDARRRVLRRRRGARAEEHHLGGRARPRRGDLDRPAVPRRGPGQASAAVDDAHLAEDGHPRVELRQRDRAGAPVPRPAEGHEARIEEHQDRGRAGLRPEARVRRGAALPQLRRADGVHRPAVHRVRRLRRHLPDGLHQLHDQRRRGGAAAAAAGARRGSDAGPLRVGTVEDRARDGEGRGRLPALRALRRALPDRRLGHAEVPARHGARERPLPLRGPRQRRIEPSPSARRAVAAE